MPAPYGVSMSFVENNPLPSDGVVAVPDAGETPQEAVEAPDAGETPQPEPEVVPAPEPEVTETPEDYAARVAAWGGPEAIEDAIAIAQALQDEDGVRALVEEGLKHLGIDPAKAFGTESETPDEEDPDRLLTVAEMEARLAAERNARQSETQRQRMAVAVEAVDAARRAVGVETEEEWDLVRTFAQKYATPAETDPHVLTDAVNKGYADMQAALEKAAKKYVTDRATANEQVPTPVVGGNTGGGDEPPPPPKSLDEARAVARRYLAEKGEV